MIRYILIVTCLIFSGCGSNSSNNAEDNIIAYTRLAACFSCDTGLPGQKVTVLETGQVEISDNDGWVELRFPKDLKEATIKLGGTYSISLLYPIPKARDEYTLTLAYDSRSGGIAYRDYSTDEES